MSDFVMVVEFANMDGVNWKSSGETPRALGHAWRGFSAKALAGRSEETADWISRALKFLCFVGS